MSNVSPLTPADHWWAEDEKDTTTVLVVPSTDVTMPEWFISFGVVLAMVVAAYLAAVGLYVLTVWAI